MVYLNQPLIYSMTYILEQQKTTNNEDMKAKFDNGGTV